MISWKSDKLGSNFYTPNLFIKDIFNESSSIKSKIDNTFKIDYIFLSCDSIFELSKVCDSLNDVVTENTIIFVESNFAVDLDLHVYKHYQTKFSKNVAVFSALSNIEGRKLTSGSYILLSDNINFYFGLSYMQNMKSLNDDFLMYLKKVNQQFNKLDSNFHLFIDAMNATQESIIHLHKISLHTNELAIRIWNKIIPKIIFNIISIIYEDTEYVHFIDKNQSLARDLSQNTLREITKIAFVHCDYNFELINPTKGKKDILKLDQQYLPFVPNSKELETVDMNYDHLVNLILEKYKRLNAEQHNKDSAEFVTFSFEAYCFYHKIEFPASIMFSQIFALSKKYSLESMCLKFLSQFYERLCILSGMPLYLSDNDKKINGLESNTTLKKKSLIFGRSNISVAGSINIHEESDRKLKKKSKEKKKEKVKVAKSKKKSVSSKNESTTSVNTNSEDVLVDDIAALYLDALDNVDMLQSLAPVVQEAEVESASSGSSVYTYRTIDSSTLSESYSNEYLSDSETESECSFNVTTTAGRQKHDGGNRKRMKKSNVKDKGRKQYEIPKRTGAYESLVTLKKYFDKNKKDDNKKFSSVSKIMTVDVEYEMMKRLSHNYEVHDKSRYSGIYLDNEMMKGMIHSDASDQSGSEVSEELHNKRKHLMQDISRFRRYKIEHSMKEGGMEYMSMMEKKLNNGLKNSSTNRFGYTDSISKVNKKKIEGKKPKMIEYKEKDDKEDGAVIEKPKE